MTTITINDLEVNEELDTQAMAKVSGGRQDPGGGGDFYRFDSSFNVLGPGFGASSAASDILRFTRDLEQSCDQ